jgi:hypothetical protein
MAGSYQSGLDLPSGEGSRGWGMQFRIGFHRGVRVFVPPARSVRGSSRASTAHHRAATTSATTTTASPPANRGPSVQSAVRSVPRRGGQDGDDQGDLKRSGRRRSAISMEDRRRHTRRYPCRVDGVDRRNDARHRRT